MILLYRHKPIAFGASLFSNYDGDGYDNLFGIALSKDAKARKKREKDANLERKIREQDAKSARKQKEQDDKAARKENDKKRKDKIKDEKARKEQIKNDTKQAEATEKNAKANALAASTTQPDTPDPQDTKKDNTMIYVAAGVGAVLLIAGAFIAMKKPNPPMRMPMPPYAPMMQPTAASSMPSPTYNPLPRP